MANYLVEKEISGLKADFKNSENALNAQKVQFERELLGGMGEQMVSELKNPPKPNKKLGMKIKLKKFFERIKVLFNL